MRLNNGECRMWGNPIGEMMYEALRYLAGKASPTSTFTYADISRLDGEPYETRMGNQQGQQHLSTL